MDRVLYLQQPCCPAGRRRPGRHRRPSERRSQWVGVCRRAASGKLTRRRRVVDVHYALR